MSGLNPFASQPSYNRLSLTAAVRPSTTARIHQPHGGGGGDSSAAAESDRQMEINYVNLRALEENTKNLAKEMNHYEECVGKLQDFELNLSSSLLNSSLCREDPPLRSVAECYHSVVYQTRDHTENLKMVSRRTVGEPCKKLCPEFNNIANALKKRETAIKEYNAAALKHDKASKAAKTGQNVVRLTQAKKALETAQEEYESQNKHLLLEMPQFHDKRTEYFQPCLQALVRSQVNYYGETNALYTHMTNTSSVSAHPGVENPSEDESCHPPPLNQHQIVSDKEYSDDINKHLAAIKGLSIVGM